MTERSCALHCAIAAPNFLSRGPPDGDDRLVHTCYRPRDGEVWPMRYLKWLAAAAAIGLLATSGCGGSPPELEILPGDAGIDVEASAPEMGPPQSRPDSTLIIPQSDASITTDGSSGPDDVSISSDGGPDCGNGVLDPGEQCDDGNRMPGDGCDGACHVDPSYRCPEAGVLCTFVPSVCGNGIIEPGELCDDGTESGARWCSPDCRMIQKG